MPSLAITFGAGLARPSGSLQFLSTPDVNGVVIALRKRQPLEEAWWGPHTWTANKRGSDNWLSSVGVLLDVDYSQCTQHKTKDRTCTDCAIKPTAEMRSRIEAAFKNGTFPGSLAHLTPNGIRPYFHFANPCVNRDEYQKAAQGAAELVRSAIERIGITVSDPNTGEVFQCYSVDDPTVEDLARLMFAPNAYAKGVQRNDEIYVLRTEPFDAAVLAASAPPIPAAPDPVVRPAPRRTNHAARSISEATAAWNADHPGDWPRSAGECPICQHNGCFGRLPNDDTRWTCFSTNHGNVGVQGANCHHGDALDLEAALSGITAVEVLRRDGYIAAKREPRPEWNASTPPDDNEPPADDPRFAATHQPDESDPGATIHDLDSARVKVLHSNSYFTAVHLISIASRRVGDHRSILDNMSLRYNEMTGVQELGGIPITDEDITRIRYNIERQFSGGVNKKGDQLGMKLSKGDIGDAVNQVAAEDSYHPVREWLETLHWDGVSRLNSLCEDVLSAPNTLLNQAICRRFFVGAVARAMQPGCKFDTMWILVGDQGSLKSTFFNTLADPWFMDSPIDIRNKDAFQVLRTAWIAEWAELESMLRARDVNAVKSFLSSRKDDYRQSYGKRSVTVPRSVAIVGTTNEKEFLVDESGNRRLWTMRVGLINMKLLFSIREQLWAEAVAIYRSASVCLDCVESWTKRCDEHAWWLNPGEQAMLNTTQKDLEVSDAWDSMVLAWMECPRLPRDPRYPIHIIENPLEPLGRAPTTADAISGALGKPRGQWTKGDEMRVARILHRFDWERTTDPQNKNSKTWRKKSS